IVDAPAKRAMPLVVLEMESKAIVLLLAVAWYVMPVNAAEMLAYVSEEPVALGSKSTPDHVLAAPPAAVSVMGCEGDPFAVSVPLTFSSARLNWLPHAMMSVLANWSVAPGGIVSVTPGATVTSPGTLV